MKDYAYIVSHFNEYALEYSEMEKEFDNIIKEHHFDAELLQSIMSNRTDIINKAFHEKLIMEGKESVPESCNVCPFHELEYDETVKQHCSIGTHVFPGAWIFNIGAPKPNWCKLNQYIRKEK